MRMMFILSVVSVVIPASGVGSVLGAPMLQSIGVLDPANPASAVTAISSDGTWAVGHSNGLDSAGTTSIRQPIIWSQSTGLVQLPNTGDFNGEARGVAVKPDGYIGIAGYVYNTTLTTPLPKMHGYKALPSNLKGGTWTLCSGASTTGNDTVGPYNAARVKWLTDGTVTGDYLISGRRGNGARGIAVTMDANTYIDYPNGTPRVVANSVASRLVNNSRPFGAGYDNGNPNGLRRALLVYTTSAPQLTIPGGVGYQSEALGVSPDGLFVAPGDASNAGVLCGYDQDVSGLPHAFIWKINDPAMTILGEAMGDNQSTAIDVRVIGGNWTAVGYSSDGITERAVMWLNGSMQPVLLSSLLAGAGVDTSGWASLSRITSMSDDGMTVAGWGIWAEDGSTRGFVAVIPEPAALSLLVLGGCALLRRRQ
ncbi:MAG TPA: hypothetical protein PLL20_16570 [Phycisphaerae bacterium]|nr:hypothetical protein [Phycisphaerae bacterium]HRR85355.1 hypothetical protein [Phycisphaerae bacterium]